MFNRFISLAAVTCLSLGVVFSVHPPALAESKDIPVLASPSYELKKPSYELYKLLIAGDYQKLHEEFEKLKAKGYAPWDGAGYFGQHYAHWKKLPKEEIIAAVNHWIEKGPVSTYPYTIRGEFALNSAWDARGSEWAQETPEDNFNRMHLHLKVAIDDLLKAVELDPKNVYAWGMLIHGLRLQGEKQKTVQHYFEEARKNVPDYYHIYHHYLFFLAPKWGGSVDKLWGFVNAAEKEMPQSVIPLRLRLQAHEIMADAMALSFDNYQEGYEGYYANGEVQADIKKTVHAIEKIQPTLNKVLTNYAKTTLIGGNLNERYDYNAKAAKADPVLAGADVVLDLAYHSNTIEDRDAAVMYMKTYLAYFEETGEPAAVKKAHDYLKWYDDMLAWERQNPPAMK